MGIKLLFLLPGIFGVFSSVCKDVTVDWVHTANTSLNSVLHYWALVSSFSSHEPTTWACPHQTLGLFMFNCIHWLCCYLCLCLRTTERSTTLCVLASAPFCSCILLILVFTGNGSLYHQQSKYEYEYVYDDEWLFLQRYWASRIKYLTVNLWWYVR